MYSVAKSISYNVRLIHYDRRKLALSLPTEINTKIDANEVLSLDVLYVPGNNVLQSHG